MSSAETTSVLYIEDNPLDWEFVRQQLSGAPDLRFERVECFVDGAERVRKGNVDLVLLDLNLPDSPGGLETFVKARHEIPIEIPIVVYTSIDDEELGANAVKKGATDYLVKGKTDGRTLAAALRRALERHAEESFFRTVVYSSVKPIVVVDGAGKVRFVNGAAERLFGRPAETWVGRVFGHPVDPDHPSSIRLPGGPEVELRVAETEFRGEVVHLIEAAPKK
jgi:CheY-like chemotaxis protein